MSYDIYITTQGQLFVAEVPALPGCRTIGRSEPEVIENIKSIVEGYLEALKRRQRSLPIVKIIRVVEAKMVS